MSSGNTEIRLGGIGGQGIALAGSLLGKAAAIYDGKEAVFTQTHGPEARGGASRADVIIGEAPVAYPFAASVSASVTCSSPNRKLEFARTPWWYG